MAKLLCIKFTDSRAAQQARRPKISRQQMVYTHRTQTLPEANLSFLKCHTVGGVRVNVIPCAPQKKVRPSLFRWFSPNPQKPNSIICWSIVRNSNQICVESTDRNSFTSLSQFSTWTGWQKVQAFRWIQWH